MSTMISNKYTLSASDRQHVQDVDKFAFEIRDQMPSTKFYHNKQEFNTIACKSHPI